MGFSPSRLSLTAQLLSAARLGQPQALQTALSLGADPLTQDERHHTALHWAAGNGNTACLALLLPYSNPHQTDRFGSTALHHAAYYSQADCLTLLLPVSDTLYQDCNGNSALHHACHSGALDCIALLLPHSDLHQVDRQRRTALMRCQLNGYSASARLIDGFLRAQVESVELTHRLLPSTSHTKNNPL